MRTRHGKPRESNDQTLWQKIGCQLSSIRVQLTLWYVVTTTAVLALFRVSRSLVAYCIYQSISNQQPISVLLLAGTSARSYQNGETLW
jgi:hypothetical protein